MATDKWKAENRGKQLQYQREWYSRNQEKQKNIVRKRQKEIATWFREYKSTLKCSSCPENHPSTFDFHHLNGSKKDMDLSVAIHSGWGRERILKELSKCIVLCSNCHRKLHWNERKQ